MPASDRPTKRARLELGPFDLIEPIARGGMGEVWRGLHRRHELLVAIKIISRLEDATQFRSEVRNAARLAHPRVVLVFDQGEVSADTAYASGGRLRASQPYLAMELASGGTLRDRKFRSFGDLAHVLGEILDALGHAHARGVIHRDLKPANVLFAGAEDERPGLKLSDFGIARAMRHTAVSQQRQIIGTLRYMAPEQILGRFRDEGPWTDLYALGAMAHQLAAGRPLFGDTSGRELAHHHLNVPPPPLRPRMPVPDGFQMWLDRLLAKRPLERFEMAADAADALAELGAPRVGKISTSPNVVFHNLPSATDTLTRNEAPASLAPSMPRSWEPPIAPPSQPRLVGAGLGLWGLRPIPMVARQRERDALWAELATVIDRRRPRVVLLSGRAGTGKSRLCEWLTERAHEVGTARCVRTAHGPIAGNIDGVSALVQTALGAEGLERELVRERALRLITDRPLPDDSGDYDAAALAELACISDDDGGGADRVRFTRPEERYQVVRRLLRRLTGGRAMILWLEDVHWGGDTVRFVSSLLGAINLPILVLANYRDGALPDRADERLSIETLARSPHCVPLVVESLSGDDRTTLAERLLGLSSALSAEVAARTEGNPLFAVQLVGDWVKRGLLRVSDAGFELADGASTEIPDDIHELWRSRIDALVGSAALGDPSDALQPTPEQALVSLEVAAALGQSISSREWRASCIEADVPPDVRVLELMLTDGFALPREDGWEFSHGMLRESLERRASDAGRLRAHHRACARALSALYVDSSASIAARQGRHLVAAGDLEDALPHLLAGAEAYRLAGDHAMSHALHDELEAAMAMLGITSDDRRWVRASILRAATYQQEGALEEAIERLGAAAWSAINGKFEDLVARAETVRGRIHFDMGNPTKAREAYERAKLLLEKIGDEDGLVSCLNGLGSVCMWLRDLPAAIEVLEQAKAHSDKHGNLLELGQTLRVLAHVHHCERDWDKTIELYQRARACFEHAGCRLEVASCINDLGEVARATGELGTAEKHYREAAHIFATLGAPGHMTANYNLGLVLLHRGNVSGARAIFATELERIEGHIRTVDQLWLHAALLACAAREMEWVAWESHAGEVERLVAETGFVDEDIAELTVLTGRVTAAAREPERARRVFELARAQLVKMEHADRVADIDAALAALG